jgi:hypothetical protein
MQINDKLPHRVSRNSVLFVHSARSLWRQIKYLPPPRRANLPRHRELRPELAFFADEGAAIIDELSKLDLDTYTTAGAIEALKAQSSCVSEAAIAGQLAFRFEIAPGL